MTIYFPFVYKPDSGGDYVNLDHIETLNRLGVSAKVLYCGADKSYLKDFSPDVPLVINGEVDILPDDIIVTSEGHRFIYNAFNTGAPRVIMHNQNPFTTRYGFDSSRHINAHSLERIIVPSGYTGRKLEEMGVKKPTHIIYPYVPDYFQPAEKSKKPIKIAYSARKRRAEPPILLFYFRSVFNLPDHVEFINLEGIDRKSVAKYLSECAIFASFAEREAMGLMALEAMASGCHVVGYSGYTDLEKHEIINDSNGDWVGEGEYLKFAQKLCDAIDLFLSGAPNPKVEAGLKLVNSRFRKPHFEQDLKAAYEQILGQKLPLENKE